MKRLILSLVVILLAIPVMAQRVRGVRPELTPAPYADATPEAPDNGYPVLFLKQNAPAGHITVRLVTRQNAPWTDAAWMAQQRTNAAGQIVMNVMRVYEQHRCILATLSVPAVSGQVAQADLDVSKLDVNDAVDVESWHSCCEVHFLFPQPLPYGQGSDLNATIWQSGQFPVFSHTPFALFDGVCP